MSHRQEDRGTQKPELLSIPFSGSGYLHPNLSLGFLGDLSFLQGDPEGISRLSPTC